MPEMTPVANQIQPPDPMKGINTFSGILGLRQQQQALQTGQYEQQTARATASQASQRDQELQAAQRLVFNGAKSGDYTLPDGSLNRQKMSDDLLKVAPTYGGEISSRLLSQANEIVANQQAHFNLSAGKRKQMGETFGALAGDPELDNSKVIDSFNELADTMNDPEERRMLFSMATHLPPNAKPEDLRSLMSRWAAAATGENLIDQGSNAAGQRVNVNRFSGGLSMPPGSNEKTNPSTPSVAGTTAYHTGTASADIDRANEVGGMAQSASATIALTQRVDQLAKEINSGHLAAMVAKGSNYLGFSSVAEARTELQKDLGQLRGAVAGRAGSDQRASEILEGYPTDTTPEHTIHAAMDYIRGSARQTIARNRLLAEYKRGDPENLRGFQAADNALVSSTDPLMHEFASLKPEERKEFYRRNFRTSQDAQAFKDRVTAAQRHTKLLGGNE
jgi:hypothetical protein